MVKLVGVFILAFISNVALASSNNVEEFLYHCPSYDDIKYERGQFTATTNYNGLKTNWFSVQTFPEATLNINFIRASMISDCIGGLCKIDCVYKPNSSTEKYIFLEIPYQAYRFSHAESGSWKDNICESNNPINCNFYVIKDNI